MDATRAPPVLAVPGRLLGLQEYPKPLRGERRQASDDAALSIEDESVICHLNRKKTMQTTVNATQVPAGFRLNGVGHMVPEHLIPESDKLRDETVLNLIKRAKALSDELASFKKAAMSEAQAFLALAAREYSVELGGKKGNVTLMSFDGRTKINIAVADSIQFDERLLAAKELIDQCIHKWSQGSRDEIKLLVQDAFQTDKEGKISTGRVLGLRRHKIEDPQWQLAMTAISDSVQTVGSKSYIRFYQRPEGSDQFVPVSLDIAAL